MNTELLFLLVSIVVLLVNVLCLGLSMKLYTEILKDASQNRRAREGK